MEEVELLLDLVPGGFDQPGLVVDELKVVRKRTVEFYLEGNGLSFDDLLYDVFIGVQPDFQVLHAYLQVFYVLSLYLKLYLQALSAIMLLLVL